MRKVIAIVLIATILITALVYSVTAHLLPNDQQGSESEQRKCSPQRRHQQAVSLTDLNRPKQPTSIRYSISTTMTVGWQTFLSSSVDTGFSTS